MRGELSGKMKEESERRPNEPASDFKSRPRARKHFQNTTKEQRNE